MPRSPHDPKAGCRGERCTSQLDSHSNVRELAYGELRERTRLGETVTEQTIAAIVGRAVALFLAGHAVARAHSRR